MLYQVLAVVIGLIAVVLALLGIKQLLNRYWFAGFIKGLFGVVLLVFAVGAALSAVQFLQFHQSDKSKQLATVSISAAPNGGAKAYQIEMIEPISNKNWSFIIQGDQWQLDARLLRWSRGLAGSGFETGYSLEKFSGRFYELDVDSKAKHNSEQLMKSALIFDFWAFWHKNISLSFLEADYSSVTFMPLSDGAMFGVSLSTLGLQVVPLNDEARLSLE